LQSHYDSRPYWHSDKLVPGVPTSQATADLAIEHLIPCESGGRTIDELDTNGKMSYGILQFQDWSEWERMSGITGDPNNSDDAIRMAEWGIEHGMIDHWGCARILGET
jgi:Transglycosylase-like domain